MTLIGKGQQLLVTTTVAIGRQMVFRTVGINL
jgi:hypothetical protein